MPAEFCAPLNRRQRGIKPEIGLIDPTAVAKTEAHGCVQLPIDPSCMNHRKDMSDDLTVRFVTRQDYDQWLPLWDGYNAFYGRSGATALSPEITADDLGAFFRRV